MAQRVEMGMYSFERGIIALHFGENKQVSLCPFRRKHCRLVVQVSFVSIARFTIVRQMAL